MRGQGSGINRLASLSELDCGQSREDPYMRTVTMKIPAGTGRLSNLEMNAKVREQSGRASPLQGYNSFGSFTSGQNIPRSSSVLGKPSLLKVTPQPIEGSFIVMDD